MVSALGLDLGAKRIGVAGCDRTGLIATGLMTIKRTSFESVVNPLSQLAEDREVELLVIGMPYTMSGEVGYQAKKIQKFARRLSEALSLPIEFVDERLTSVEAKQILIDRRIVPSKDKGLIDRTAAAIILQQWLDQRRRNQHKQSQHKQGHYKQNECADGQRRDDSHENDPC